MTGELALRLGIFGALFGLFALWETFAPARARLLARLRRWPAHMALAGLGALAVRLLLPATAFSAALWAQARHFGLFNWLGAPAWLAIPVSLLAFDLLIYLQHAAFHRIPILWRLHRLHHADVDLDVTTALRFHPFEIAASMVLKSGLAIGLGAPPASVVLFEMALNGLAMFNHSNARLPPRVEAWARKLIVTPDLHEIHHSIRPSETHSNYGFNLTLWDRLFGTFCAKSADEAITIGLPIFRAPPQNRLDLLLIQPFRKAR